MEESLYPTVCYHVGEDYRAERLRNAFIYAAGVLGLKPHELKAKITKLSDYKGELTCTWATDPEPEAISAFEQAWEALGEQKSAVSHDLDRGSAID